MGYRRGFKSEANWYARSMRAELGLPFHAPLSPLKVAAHLGYVVSPLSKFRSDNLKEVGFLTSPKGKKEFSAITLFFEGISFIIHNDSHHPHRQNSNLSHEIAHGLLMHKPSPLTGIDGVRIIDPQQESEAHWLGGALLISEEAALHIVESRQPYEIAQKVYGVSNDLLQWRLRVTGALVRVARRKVA